MLEFIRKTELKVYKSWKKVWKWIFKCSYCWNEKELLVWNEKRTSSCWCISKELFYKTRMEKSENNKTVLDYWDYIKFSLTNWWYCILDKDDYDKVKWSSWYKSVRWYVETRKNWKLIKIHRLIKDSTEWNIIDHINRDKLDNRKVNLRYCTHTENMRNTWSRTSLYKWVYKDKKWKYIASCKWKYIWSFTNEKDAGIAYNEVAIKEFAEFAFLNIIK